MKKRLLSLSVSLMLVLVPTTFGVPDANYSGDQSYLKPRLEKRPDPVQVNWSSLRVGDVVGKRIQQGQECMLPKLKVHTFHKAGKRRFVSLAPSVSCDVVVIGHGERDEASDTSNGLSGGSVSVRRWDPKLLPVVLTEQRRTRRLVNIDTDTEYSHGHVFVGVSGQLVMEVHMAFNFGYDTGYAWLESPGPWGTFSKHPEIEAYDNGWGCNEYAPGAYCTHSGEMPQYYTYVQVDTAGEPDGTAWCDGETNTYITPPFYEYEYQC